MSEAARRRAANAWVVVAAALGVALRWRATRAPLFADDFFQRAMLRGAFPAPRAWWDLFSFVRDSPADHAAIVGRGVLPWWTDPHLQIAMFRPLSSALTALDHALFGGDPFVAHLHSLAWWCALLVALSSLYRRLFSPRVAALATLLVAVDDAASTPVAWLSNRNALVAAFFGALGLRAFVDALSGSRRALALSVVAFAFASLAGEYALAWAPAVVLVALSSRGASTRPWWSAGAALAPIALTLALARALGYGARATASYVDPLVDPARWLSGAPSRFGALLVDLVYALPAEWLTRVTWTPPLTRWAVALAALGVALHASVARAEGEEGPRLRAFAGAALLGCLPLVSVEPAGRLLLVPGALWAPVVAWLISRAFERRPRGLRAWLGVAAAVTLAFIHLVMAVASTRRELWWFHETAALAERLRRQSPSPPCRSAGVTQVALGVGEIVTLNYLPLARVDLGCAMPRAWRALVATRSPVLVRRVDAQTLELSAAEGELFMPTGLSFLRDPANPLRAGDRVRLPGFEATVLDARRGAPSRVRFRFDAALEGGDVWVGALRPEGLVRVPLPAVGEERRYEGPELFGP